MIRYVINNFKVIFKNNIPKCYSFIRNRKIGILGGSFNPAHAGHLHISNTAKKHLGLNEIWWLVAPQNRLKSTFEMESTAYRLSDARRITEKSSYVKVLDLEEKNKLYASYQTVGFLNSKTQKTKFVWLMGSDILDNFNKWLYPELIVKRIYIAVISRPGFSSSFVNAQNTRLLGTRLKTSKSKFIFNHNKPIWVFIKNKLLAISSTELRKNHN